MLKACKIGERTCGKLANFYVIVDYYKGGGNLRSKNWVPRSVGGLVKRLIEDSCKVGGGPAGVREL